MKEPTNQMLIDALCIVMAQQLRPVDLDRDPAITKIIGRAQLIVINAAPIAIARIMREAEQERAEPEVREYRLLGSDRVFYTANALEIDTRNSDTMEFMQDAMRQGAKVKLIAQPINGPIESPLVVFSAAEQSHGFWRYALAPANQDAAQR